MEKNGEKTFTIVDGIVQTNDDNQIKLENETALDLFIKQFNDNIDDDDDLAYSLDNLKIEVGVSNLYFKKINNINKKFSIVDFYKPNEVGHKIVEGNRGCVLSIKVVYELLNELHYVNVDMERYRKRQVVSDSFVREAGVLLRTQVVMQLTNGYGILGYKVFTDIFILTRSFHTIGIQWYWKLWYC